MLHPGIAKRLITDADWIALRKHILESMDDLNRLNDIDFTDPVAGAIKAEGRKEAQAVLQVILLPFFATEDDESTIDNKKVTASKVGMV